MIIKSQNIFYSFILTTLLFVFGFDACALEHKNYHNILDVHKDMTADKKKKIVLLFASWCGGCKLKFPQMIKLANTYPQYSFYAISFDKEEHALSKYISRYNNSNNNFTVAYSKFASNMDYSILFSRLGLDNFRGGIPYLALLDERNNVLQEGNFNLQHMIDNQSLLSIK